MSGHSKWSSIKHKKAATDAKRGKIFTKLIKEITVSARMGGGDPDANPRLRSAILAAKTENMPKDNIERAIKKGQGGDGESYDEIRYEAYGPGGVAFIVEALTDNRNRTASEVRAAFSRHGGSLAETNAVSFQFDRIGQIRYGADVASEEAMLEAAIEAGAEDCQSSEDGHEITCAPDDLAAVTEALEAKFGTPEASLLTWRPQVTVPVEDDKAETLFKLLETLDESDDVQRVVANFEVSDTVMEKLQN